MVYWFVHALSLSSVDPKFVVKEMFVSDSASGGMWYVWCERWATAKLKMHKKHRQTIETTGTTVTREMIEETEARGLNQIKLEITA